jgi:phosphate transport system substrate-binding protein
MKMKLNNQLIILMVSLLFVSCKKNMNGQQDSPTSGVVQIAVDETFAPIVDNEIDVFESIYKTAGIVERVCPEIDAFNLLLKDSVRMIIATRTLNEEENAYFKNKKIFPKEVKLAVDAVALIVNNNNNDTLLTTANVKRILLGEISQWNQINPMSKLGAIKVIFDNPKSSTAEYAVKEICGNTKLASSLSAVNSNLEVIEYVSNTPEAIGFIGASWISNHKDTTCMGFLDKIKIVAVSKESIANEENSYQPYQAYMATGQYPYIRNVYSIITDPRVGLPAGFTTFIASDRGQRIILKSGILPATQPIRLIQVKE